MIYIIAANLGQARQAAADSKIEPKHRWTYLHSVYQLFGTKNPSILRHRSAEQHDNISELEQAISTRFPGLLPGLIRSCKSINCIDLNLDF
jgi:hypothetical protein